VTVLDRPVPAAAGTAPRRRPTAGAAVAVGLGLLVVLGLALVVGGADPVDAVPAARLAVRVAALGTVGTLLFAVVLRPGRPLPESTRRALRAASAWATAWAAATVVHALLTLGQIVGPSVPAEALGTFLTDLPAGRATVIVLVATATVAGAARRCTTVRGAAALLVLAGVGLVVPTVLTGHSAAADDHVLAVTNLSVHVVAASVWVGGLLALLLHGRGRADLAPAATRFSAVALACFLATGASGLLAAWLVLADSGDLTAALGTGYGLLLLAKTTLLVALGMFGRQHRQRTLPRLRTGEAGSFRRFAGVETVVLMATVALAVGLSASPPPATGAVPSPGRPAVTATPASPSADPMAGHDHGELSVAVLIDETRFHVAGPVDAGSRVTVHNATATPVTITAADGTFDVVVPAHALMTFPAPAEAGSYAFSSRHDGTFSDVLEVR
jgi:putative copper resistance protein D